MYDLPYYKEKNEKVITEFIDQHTFIKKNNDHHKAFLNNENVLVVFTGNHTYVSGTWYSNPHTPSTWNNRSVHAKGIIMFLDDVDVFRTTTLHFENQNKNSTTIF